LNIASIDVGTTILIESDYKFVALRNSDMIISQNFGKSRMLKLIAVIFCKGNMQVLQVAFKKYQALYLSDNFQSFWVNDHVQNYPIGKC